ncbi:Zn(II)2Cys6 transcription factor [Pyrenophora seminiperda CCB06]|uniref:Zn(II)2Cys6 transcription factor n=1 Tax=Pyrenophora seminiperda CCB06 TaxID=1302712 RepID=A0A3M7MHN1_9PLEO|nr:Zn(II)2Cys6 transcription factor [Pyrenophora seminiperda CCB06]
MTNTGAATTVGTSPAPPLARQYLVLTNVKKLELPYHSSYDNAASDHSVSLVQFLNSLFAEVQKINFDEDSKACGTWSPKSGHVMMPPLEDTGSGEVAVPISVEKRTKTVNRANWAVRTSYHSDAHVKFSELGELLAEDHSCNEALYTPSILDAVELLRWGKEDLAKALSESNHREEIHKVEMFISQMVHTMPKVAGCDLLQHRVFHALVVTTQTYSADSASELSQSITIQLPVDYASLADVDIVKAKSHVKTSGSSLLYHYPQSIERYGLQPNVTQKSREGKKLIEGRYVSLERLLAASTRPSLGGKTIEQIDATKDGHHRWDMMTLSTAGGITRIAPKGVQEKETLNAIAEDVEYVLRHIARHKQATLSSACSESHSERPSGEQMRMRVARGCGEDAGFCALLLHPSASRRKATKHSSAGPQAHSQWAAPTPTQTSNPWNQAQHQSYPPQQDQPPPPPPKPYGFAAAVQREAEKQQRLQQQHYQSAQNWSQEQQQNVGFGSHTGGDVWAASSPNVSTWQQSHQPPPLPPRPNQHPAQSQQQYQQSHQPQYASQGQFQYTSQTQFSTQQGRVGHGVSPQSQPVGQPEHPQAHFQQPPVPATYTQAPYDQPIQQGTQYPPPQSLWQSPSLPDYTLAQQNVQPSLESQQIGWQTENTSQGSFHAQQYSHVSNEETPARTSLNRTDTAQSTISAPDIPHQSNLQSQPVSPISNRASLSTASDYQPGSRRNESISSVARATFHAQRAENRISSPKPAMSTLPMPLLPRDDKSKFSVLAAGAPSDWEHLGAGEEVDDEALFCSKEKEDQAVQPTSVELPAHVPSPPPTQYWPSPVTYSAPLASNEWNTNFVPTPPSGGLTGGPTPQSSQPGFVVEDAIVAPLRTTPRPTQGIQVTAQEGIYPIDNEIIGVTKLTSPDHVADIKAKDEIIDQLRAELQREKNHSNAEMEIFRADKKKLESESEAVRTHLSNEMDVLHAQIETMKIAADQASASSEASAKENGVTIERLKEDVEGKEHNIEERDKTIAELQRELEAERERETPKPTLADLIPDLDPWYVGSLERYIAMLRGESTEPQVEEKIKIFRAFMKAESEIRGIDYFDAPPKAPTIDPEVSQQQGQTPHSRRASNASTRKLHLNVQVPQASVDEGEDDYQYSPGGRPILMTRNTLPRTETTQVQVAASPSVQSTTILTPTSSMDDNTNKTPVQSQLEEWSRPKYRAYVPPTSISASPVSFGHGQRASIANVQSPDLRPRCSSKGRDEIFFGSNQPNTQKSTRRQSSYEPSVPIPAPLAFNSRRPLSTIQPLKPNPNDVLDALLPSHAAQSLTCGQVQELRAKLAGVGSKSDDIDVITRSWEASASRVRREKDDARRKREEESEEHNEDLFNSNDISYAEMNQLEEDFKEKEAELKAQEDKDEYESYVDTVFDPLYAELQKEIIALTDLYHQAKHHLHTSTSGLKTLQSDHAPSTKDSLELLKDVHKQVEKRHESVAQLIANRDKRYKKMEIQPLYAAGNISKMKTREKQFEDAEKQAVLKTKHEKAERMMRDVVNIAEDVVVDAVSAEQQDIDSIVTHIREVPDGTGDEAILSRAVATIKALKACSRDVLSLFHSLEIELNKAVIDAEIARVKAEGGADAGRMRELEAERSEEEKKTREEFERKKAVLESDEVEIGELVQRKMARDGGKKEAGREFAHEKTGGDSEKEERLRLALEAAKRRNGDM